jgi:thioredoxin reductase
MTSHQRGLQTLDCVIVGAGPAGLQLSYYLARSGVDVVVLDGADRVGSFFTKYPRNRRLISFNKRASISSDPEVNRRWDWNGLLDDGSLPFGDYTKQLLPAADDLVTYLGDYAKLHDLPIRLQQRVERVSRDEATGMFHVATADQEYRCRYLVMATGMSEPYVPPIPGIELVEGYETAATDPSQYEGQRVLVIGKGNSGLELADCATESAALVHIASPKSVRLAMRTRHSGGVRLHNSRLFDMYQLKMLNSVLDCNVERIESRAGKYFVTVTYSHADEERDVLIYDRVIRCTGFRFDSSIFSAECTPALSYDDRFAALTTTWESVNVPDMFFAGTLMQEQDLRVAATAFIAGFRYNIGTLHKILQERYHNRPYPEVVAPASPAALADWLLCRASRTSALWLQFQHLCDVAVVDQENGNVTVRQEWPIDDVVTRYANEPHYYTLHYAWGRWTGDLFAVARHPNHEQASSSVFLHPVVRRYSGRRVLAEHHVLEDLVGVYHPDFVNESIQSHNGVAVADYHRIHHLEPLRDFLIANELRAPEKRIDPVEGIV